MSTRLLRKAKSTMHARAHAETARSSSANNYVNNTHNKADNGQCPPPVPPRDAGKTNSSHFFHHFSSIRDRRRSRIDLSTAVESETSTQARLQKQDSITQLRRRLVRKASTFNLHSRHLRTSSATAQDVPNHRSEHLFPDTDINGDTTVTATYSQPLTVSQPERPATASTIYSEAAETILHCATSVNTTESDSENLRVTSAPTGRSHLEEQLPSINQYQANPASHGPSNIEKNLNTQGITWLKMATATPPLPYDTLKKITIDACETALSSATAYDHPKTESWNTTIINTILARLVGETSGSPDSPHAAPKYKFVVNSTIVQHRNSMSEHGGGRRGMHSAAGAYWNNEKDGMWSFKYDAGDSKGLDVVVGIVWVWVG